jgi:sugar phosphate isomerase/epimerase
MYNRREFLNAIAAGVGACAVAPAWAASQDETKISLNAPVGVQLWSFREYLPKDLQGTLKKVRGLGFREVEGAGTWKHTKEEMRAALDAAGLRCQSAHIGFEQLADNIDDAFAQVKAVGATWAICPWIPHEGDTFTRENALKAAEGFNKFGKAAASQGLHFGYHCHGYDFVPSTEGTLFDTIAANTDPERVAFQIDVFHAFDGGADPAKLIERYKARVVSLHLKDLKKGVEVKVGTATAPADEDVPVGSGQVDMPAVLRAAKQAGVKMYYIEDESPDPWGHIPQSIEYLKSVRS